MNLQHGLFSNFNGKHFICGVGPSKEKKFVMKVLLGKNIFAKYVFQKIILAVSKILSTR